MAYPAIKKHPLAVAWEEWLASEEGKNATNLLTLTGSASGEYLRNRIHQAFNAGVEAQAKLESLKGQQ